MAKMMMTLIMLHMLLLNTIQTAQDGKGATGDATIIGQSILFLTFLIKIVLDYFKDKRDRKWKLEDAERQQQQLQEHERKMREKLDEQTAELKRSARTRVEDLGKTLDQFLTERGRPLQHERKEQ
jgi:hypothetical protein